MKKYSIALLLIFCLLFFSFNSITEGLLPSLTEIIGKPMPSLGKALGRYPDAETVSEDGDTIEIFYGITEKDFNSFSVYLDEQGATLENYQTAGNSFIASIQAEGKIITFTYDTQTLEARVTYPKGTYDEWLDYAKMLFESAIQLIDAEKTDEGISILRSIPNYKGYKPVTEYLEALTAARTAYYCNVGSYVLFGSYEQDNNIDNGKEPIEWLVLDYDKENNRALLISRYGLDAKPYNQKAVNIAWKECTLRAWLNEEFMNNAFTVKDRENIITTMVENDLSQGYSKWNTNEGEITRDKIFLLSYAEANKYLGVTMENSDNMKSRIAPTEYALQAGAWTNDNCRTVEGSAAGWWWLRSSGSYRGEAALVRRDGSLSSSDVSYTSGCVCPALWINLGSDIF